MENDLAMPVFLLFHARSEDKYRDFEKLIGVYSSHGNAEHAITRLVTKPGFRDSPCGFEIVEYKIDSDQNWADGFVSWDEASEACTHPED